jgi:hypothetical protein
MAQHTIRVVIHGATAKNYDDLHTGMVRLGANRTIRGDDGVTYDLPDGEYDLSSTSGAVAVRDAVYRVARAVRPDLDPSVLVTTSAARAWRLRPVPGQS